MNKQLDIDKLGKDYFKEFGVRIAPLFLWRLRDLFIKQHQLSVTETLTIVDAKIAFLSLKYDPKVIQACRDVINSLQK